MKIKKSKSDYVLDFFLYTFLLLMVVVTIYPIWYVIVASFSSSSYLAAHHGFLLWPGNFGLGAYKAFFQNPLLVSGFKNIMIILVVGLPINIVLTVLCAYFMACQGMMLKKPIVYMIMFTMYFSGGLIPTYLNIKDLGLLNSLWALILPGALSVYNALICKTAMEAIPESLSESAYLDGANDLQILFKVFLPLIKPTLAVLVLYYSVGHWNSWFNASIYIKDQTLLPIQNIIRGILLANTDLTGSGMVDNFDQYAESVKYSSIVISTLPIMCIYPFLQKYFTKGAMIGAVKG